MPKILLVEDSPAEADVTMSALREGRVRNLPMRMRMAASDRQAAVRTTSEMFRGLCRP